MNKLTAALAVVLGMVAAVRAAAAEDASAAPAWTTTFASEARYFSWTSTRGYPVGANAIGHGSGAEVYVPFAGQIVGHPNDDWELEMIARGGWVWAQQYTPGLSGEVTTTTDTTLSATLTYLELNGIQRFGSLNFNLPTGQSALFGTAANSRMDPDLVDISNFGEGFNVGETLGVNLPIGRQWMVTTSVGYTSRGDYLRESPLAVTVVTVPTAQAPTTIQPGDVLTYYASGTYQSERLSRALNGSVSYERPPRRTTPALPTRTSLRARQVQRRHAVVGPFIGQGPVQKV